ncbi:FAD-dependent oxidoreductase, partial [Streptomyces cinereoruber]
MTHLIAPRTPRHVELPPRQALHGGSTQVLVVGGGPAGIGAAIGAANAGARVVLVERYGFLGGNATAALVMPLMSFHNEVKQAVAGDTTRLLPPDHGEGEPVVGGVLWMLLDQLVRADAAIRPSAETGYTVPFDAELFKLVV